MESDFDAFCSVLGVAPSDELFGVNFIDIAVFDIIPCLCLISQRFSLVPMGT
jgi:hypothetical protein